MSTRYKTLSKHILYNIYRMYNIYIKHICELYVFVLNIHILIPIRHYSDSNSTHLFLKLLQLTANIIFTVSFLTCISDGCFKFIHAFLLPMEEKFKNLPVICKVAHYLTPGPASASTSPSAASSALETPLPSDASQATAPRGSCQPSFVLTTTLQTPLNMTLPRKPGAAPGWKSQPQHRS